MTGRRRTHAAIACAVLALHLGALWVLQHSLLSHDRPDPAPAPLMVRLLEPPAPRAVPPATEHLSQAVAPKPARPRSVAARPDPNRRLAAAPSPQPQPQPLRQAPAPPTPAPDPAPQPLALARTARSTAPPSGTAGATRSAPAAPSAASGTPAGAGGEPTAAEPAASALAKAPPAVELPSSDAHYLQNPPPQYPPISRRLGEQGTVLVDVLVSEQGLAQDAKVKTSSGFARLDDAAVATVSTWRFVPGKRAGIPQSMWFTVPIVFQIQ